MIELPDRNGDRERAGIRKKHAGGETEGEILRVRYYIPV